MPPPPTPENPNGPGRGPFILGFTWTMTSLALIAIGIRLYVRSKARLMASEDWTMLLAGVINDLTVMSQELRANLGPNVGLPSNLSSFSQ